MYSMGGSSCRRNSASSMSFTVNAAQSISLAAESPKRLTVPDNLEISTLMITPYYYTPLYMVHYTTIYYLYLYLYTVYCILYTSLA